MVLGHLPECREEEFESEEITYAFDARLVRQLASHARKVFWSDSVVTSRDLRWKMAEWMSDGSLL